MFDSLDRTLHVHSPNFSATTLLGLNELWVAVGVKFRVYHDTVLPLNFIKKSKFKFVMFSIEMILIVLRYTLFFFLKNTAM